MTDFDTLNDLLTHLGHPGDCADGPDSQQLADYFHNHGRPDVADLAERGWVVATRNEHFDRLREGYGKYADLLTQLLDRAGCSVDEITDYTVTRKGNMGVLVGVDTGDTARYYWKNTGHRRGRCHSNLVLMAVNETLEYLGIDRQVELLQDNDIVAFGLLPRDHVEALLAYIDRSDLPDRDRVVSPRRLTSEEFEALPKRNPG